MTRSIAFVSASHHRPARRLGRIQLNISLLIGLGIALFGLVKYLTSTQTNPVTGQAQRVALSPSQEVALGLQSAPQMIQQMGGQVPASDPRTQLVRAVGGRLVAQIGVQTPWQFEFHLLADTKTVNAFALPGGQVFITLALLSQLENEAQLAGVLGHEIGHVIERHSAQQMATQGLGQSLVGAIAVGSSQQDNGQIAAYAAQYANQMLQLKYGRNDELQSDGYGVDYMTKAGYDPREMIGVMEILKRASGGSGRPEFSSTHPNPENREAEIEKHIRMKYPQGLPQGLTKGMPLNRGAPTGAVPGGSMPPGTPARSKW